MRQSRALVRVSRAGSAYTPADDSDGPVYDVVPVYPAQHDAQRKPRAPLFPAPFSQRNFSAQLLHMGLYHQVDGLVRTTGSKDDVIANPYTAHYHYDNAAHDFSDPRQRFVRVRV